MTQVEQYIQWAIEGGWDNMEVAFQDPTRRPQFLHYDSLSYHSSIFLEPLFWQAVAKTRGWWLGDEPPVGPIETWRGKSMEFFCYVIEGDDYETALSKLN